MSGFHISIIIKENNGVERINEPVTAGIPFPKGVLTDASVLHLTDREKGILPLQTDPLAWWPDGSLKWVLLDFQTCVRAKGEILLDLACDESRVGIDEERAISIEETKDGYQVDTKAAIFFVDRKIFKPFSRVRINGNDILDGAASKTRLTTESGEKFQPVIKNIFLETKGALRSTLRVEGSFENQGKSRLVSFCSRIHFFSKSSTVKMDFTIHNPRPAKHPGGLWDLGDPGSIYFKELSLHFGLNSADLPVEAECRVAEDPVPPMAGGAVSGQQEIIAECQSPRAFRSQITAGSSPLRVYQDSSGGHNWKSRNHVNRNGEVKNSFCGYRLYSGEKITGEGKRANPVVCIYGGKRKIAAGVQYFWQNFPKAFEIKDKKLTVQLFPPDHDDVYELQGGEQKTHTIFLNFSTNDAGEGGLEWIQSPLIPHAPPEWYAKSGAIPYLIPEKDDPNANIVELIKMAIEGDRSFFRRREIIDEYGWRNFGEFYADHEAVFQRSSSEPSAMSQPLVSHYNNQYDGICGSLVQFARTGDRRWFLLGDQLCRHVVDIDIYHTEEDRPEFNHGLFWHTEHYLDAQTATHRCFSKKHAPDRNLANYGGGPSLSHNYTSGLLLHYYLTGEPSSMNAVTGLASFIENNIAIENTLGNRVFKKIKDFKRSREKRAELVQIGKVYGLDGPGRASGNSLNTLIDAFILTGEDKYLNLAEDLIRKCIGPEDDLEKRDLLDTENRWMYTVFLQSLGKYLDVKTARNNVDPMWEYARRSLSHYASWMAKNEYLYLEKPEKLEFPNETWAAQDIRKCNVMLYASKYSTVDKLTAFQQKGEYFFSKALKQFLSFQTADLMRPLVLMAQNGLMHGFWKKSPDSFEPNWERKGTSEKVKDNLYKKSEFSSTRCLLRFSPRREFQYLKWRITS